MNIDLDDLLRFTSLTHDITKIKRAMYAQDEDRFENDSEHGYQLALLALYIIDHNQLKLDAFKAMALAIVHDVVEVHAGDTPVFGDKGNVDTKTEREAASLAQLKEEWPDMDQLFELINDYESKGSEEARFVYALDKLAPMLNNYLGGGRSWISQKVTLDTVISIKTGKIDIDPTINEYYKKVLELLKVHPELFSQP